MGMRAHWLLTAAVVAGGVLAGCSDGGTPQQQVSSGSSTTAPPAREPAATTKPTGTASTAVDPRKAMPVVSPAMVDGIAYSAASAADLGRFKKVASASADLLTTPSFSAVSVGGKDAGAVAVYGTKRGVAKSPMFQDQYIVQLVNAITGAQSAPKFVRTQGQVMALSTGRVSVAGWFKGDDVVLLYRKDGAPDLVRLATSIQAKPPAR